MKIVFSIVSHGQKNHISKLLKSLDSYLVTKDIDLTVVIRDNLNENLSFTSNKYNIRHVANQTPYGFGTNHNLTFCEFPCDYFFILNPDLIFIEEVNLDVIINQIEDCLYAPMLIDDSGNEHVNLRSYPTPMNLLLRKMGYENSANVRAAWVSGAFMAVKWQNFASVSGFDERFHMYVEDCDLCLRLQRIGCEIFEDKSFKVIHQAQRSSRKNLKAFLQHLQSLFYFWMKTIVWKLLKIKVGKGMTGNC